MANGATIALSAAIEPPSEHLSQDAPIESELAIAVGEAAAAIYQALGEHQAGGFGRATKMRGGKKIARLYELHEGMTDATSQAR
jgi:hypothetical protein